MGLSCAAAQGDTVASALFSAVLSVSIAKAQPVPQQNRQPAEENQNRQSGLAVTIVDQQGAVLPHAEVILAGPKTKPGAQATGVTDDMGKVEFHSLAPGEYTITVNAKYFITERQSGLMLAAGKTSNLVITMKIDPKAAATVEVGITAEAPIIQRDAQVSHTFEMDR